MEGASAQSALVEEADGCASVALREPGAREVALRLAGGLPREVGETRRERQGQRDAEQGGGEDRVAPRQTDRRGQGIPSCRAQQIEERKDHEPVEARGREHREQGCERERETGKIEGREGGFVRVESAVENGSVRITVEDNGPGIDPAFLPHVFEPFRQADASPRRAHDGLGLGLSIARHLVELHGGSVAAANRPNGGAVLTVTLPADVQVT